MLLHSLPTILDLLALSSCIGILSCLLFIIPRDSAAATHTLQRSLWRWLLVALVALSFSSVAELLLRAAQMSRQPLLAVLALLPDILVKTHYGQFWLLRALALVVLWLGWLRAKSCLPSRKVLALLLAGALVIAFTRAASGHGADAGDFTPQQILYWLHLLAGSLWAGGLLVFARVILPGALRQALSPMLLAAMASRFSSLAGAALALVILTGLYNAWLQVGSFGLLLTTRYGQILSLKLLLVLAMIGLGASNRYVSVPLLQVLAGQVVTPRGRLGNWFAHSRFVTRQSNPDSKLAVRSFWHKVAAEAVLVVAVLACAALLVHSVPAKIAAHSAAMQHDGVQHD